MKTFHAVLKVLRNLWGSDSGLTPELERYCREEGVDAWALAEALRAAEAKVPTLFSAPKDGLSTNCRSERHRNPRISYGQILS